MRPGSRGAFGFERQILVTSPGRRRLKARNAYFSRLESFRHIIKPIPGQKPDLHTGKDAFLAKSRLTDCI
jgi:hypothetical protein